MRFRILLNELQMLLFTHPVNRARETRGELPVNSVWLWGGGTRPAESTVRMPIYARDSEARALGLFCRAPVLSPPSQLEKVMLEAEGVTLLDELAEAGECGDAYGWRDALRDLEKDWFVPLLESLRAVGPAGLCLLDPVNGRALHLQRIDAWKIWKRPRNLTSILS